MIFHKKIWMSLRKRIYLFFGKRFYIKKIKGLRYLLDIRNRVDRHIDAFSVYEKEQVEFLISELKKSKCSCFIDIGSHWGYYSLNFANEPSLSSSIIYAFEPDQVNRNQLYANIFLNDFQNRITVFDYALSSQEGELNFHHFDENNRGRSCIAKDGELVVKTEKLDKLVSLTDEVIGIKVDVEGHELDVISGMNEVLKNNACILQVESFDDVLPDLLSAMSSLGYKKIKTIDYDHYFVKL